MARWRMLLFVGAIWAVELPNLFVHRHELALLGKGMLPGVMTFLAIAICLGGVLAVAAGRRERGRR